MNKIAIITSSYNNTKVLKNIIETVLCQTLRDIELICVDDGSDDGSYELLQEYAKKDSRIKIIRFEKSRSVAQARKAGVMASNSEYIMFLNAGDSLSANACELLYHEISKRNVEILHFYSEIINCSVAKNQVDAMSKLIAPYDGKLTNTDVFFGCFREEMYHYNLCNKIYSSQLCKNAMKYIKDGYFPKAEDAYFYFVIAYFARSYEGVETPVLYHFRSGAGDICPNIIDENHFQLYCHGAHVAKSILAFLDEQGADAAYQRCAQSIYNHLISECIRVWREDVPRELKALCFDDLVSFWGRKEIVRILAETMWTQPIELADNVLGAACLNRVRRTIRTIGIFYHRVAAGGVQKVISLLIPIYHDMGYDIVLFTDEYDPEREYKLPNYVKRIVLPSSQALKKEAWKQRIEALDDALLRYQVDVLHYHASSSGKMVFDLLQIKTLGIPVVATSHEMFSQSMVNVTRTMIVRAHVLKLVDKLTVLSKSDELYWKTLGANAVYVPNPIERFPIQTVSSEKNYILWIGRLERSQKQYMDAVKILKEAAILAPDIKMIMVGNEVTKNAVNEIQEAIKTNHLENNLELHEYTTNVAPYYQHARIQLITSLHETFPMVVAEGKSFSVPQIIYDMPYLEMLKRCNGHVIVPQGDIKTAASELVRIWKNADLRKKLADEAHESMKEFLEDDLTLYWSAIFNELEEECNQYSSTVNEEYKVIFDTLLFHYMKGLENNNHKLNRLQKTINESVAEIKELKDKLAEREKTTSDIA